MNDTAFDQELDCKGMNCPLPILKTKKQMDTMSPGEVLKMIATDPGSINDMTSWTKRTGNPLLSHAQDGDDYVFYIKKA